MLKQIIMVLGFFVIAYLCLLGFVVWHENQNVQIFAKYGINSYYTIDPLTLHGHTYPTNFKCSNNWVNCEKAYEEIW